MYSFSYLEPVCCSMSSSNCCFLTCIQVSKEAGQVVWYSHLFQNFPQLLWSTVKGFGIVNKAEVDVFLELSCFFDDPVDVGSLISGSSAFSKAAWTFGSSQFTGLSGTVYSGALAHLLGAVPCGYLHVVNVLCSKTKASASGAAGMVGGQTVLHLSILLLVTTR